EEPHIGALAFMGGSQRPPHIKFHINLVKPVVRQCPADAADAQRRSTMRAGCPTHHRPDNVVKNTWYHVYLLSTYFAVIWLTAHDAIARAAGSIKYQRPVAVFPCFYAFSVRLLHHDLRRKWFEAKRSALFRNHRCRSHFPCLPIEIQLKGPAHAYASERPFAPFIRAGREEFHKAIVRLHQHFRYRGSDAQGSIHLH